MTNDGQGSSSGPRLTIGPEVGLGHYANFVTIGHNFTEVLVDFGRTVPGRQDIPVVARVVMSPLHAKQMLRALRHNLEIYERTYGPIAEPPKPAVEQPVDGAN